MQNNLNHTIPYYVFGSLILAYILTDPCFGVTLDVLQAPIRTLKSNIFGGWMIPVQILGLACSGAMSFFKQSLVPFGVGIGTVAGINFFDSYLGDGAAGALI